jgi:hypothetical protein
MADGNDSRMLTPDEQEYLRRKDAKSDGAQRPDPANPLRADVMGSMVNSDPSSPGYLGRIDKLITAHGALETLQPAERMGNGSAVMASGSGTTVPAARDRELMVRATSQPRIPSGRMMTAVAPPDVGAPRLAGPDMPTRMESPQKPKRGWLGEIGHIASRMGNIAGDIFAPGAMALIPGTDLNKTVQARVAERREARQQELDAAGIKMSNERADNPQGRKSYLDQHPGQFQHLSDRDREEFILTGKVPQKETPSDTGKTPEEVTVHDLMTGDNGQARINPQTQKPYSYLEAYQAVQKAKQEVKPEKPETQEQNRLAFQGVVGKLDAAGLPSGPKDIDKSLDLARQRGIITPEEHATARAYQAANPTPGTNLTVHVAGAQATQGIKNANQHYLYSDEDGTTHLVTGDKVPPGADALPVKDPQTFMSEAENANIVQKSFGKLAKDDLSIFDNSAARAVLATATSEEGARSMGLLVAGTGGSITLPAGTGKIIDQFLENHAPGMDDKTRRAVKDYIADYWAIKDKMLMVQMQMQNGKMGRGNKAYFDAMVSQIPGAGTADSQMARRQLADFNETLTELKKRYPDKFGAYRKAADLKSEEFGGGADSGAPPPGARVRDYTQLNK